MAKLYRITPLEKKSVEYFVDVFERMPDGTIRGFDVTETWRWGQGFRDLDEPVYDTETDRVYCQPGLGWGCELDDLCSVYVNFSDGFTEEEKEQIESLLRWETEDDDGRCGTAWLYDGDHNWEIEDDHVSIYPLDDSLSFAPAGSPCSRMTKPCACKCSTSPVAILPGVSGNPYS
jgi:hypothetical protein